MTSTDPRTLPIPDESRVAYRYVRGDSSEPLGHLVDRENIEAVAAPVVVAELLALADRLNALTASAGARYREGFDAAINEVRELIADRCDEVGTKVEDL